MPDLFDRLYPPEGQEDLIDKISIHALHAATVDYAAGQTTRAQIIAYWSLDASAQTDLNALLNAVDAETTVVDKLRFLTEFDAVMKIAEEGAKYTTKTAFKNRMGL